MDENENETTCRCCGRECPSDSPYCGPCEDNREDGRRDGDYRKLYEEE